MKELKNKTILITGGAGGLGKALSMRYVQAGAKVVALDTNMSQLKHLEEEMKWSDYPFLGIRCDITDRQACELAIAEACDHFESIDMLINNAGITQLGSFEQADPVKFRQVMEVNFFGAVNCTRAALPSLIESQGQIVAISSVAGFAPLMGRTAYAASKHAMAGFFNSLRTELNSKGVHVTIIYPSTINTGIREAELARLGMSGLDEQHKIGHSSSPELIADQIFSNILQRKRKFITGRTGKLAWWINKLMPRLYDHLMIKKVQDELVILDKKSGQSIAPVY